MVTLNDDLIKAIVKSWTKEDIVDYLKAMAPQLFLPADLNGLYAIAGQVPTLAIGEGLGAISVCQLAQVGDGALNRRALLLNNNYYSWEFDTTSYPGYVVAKPFRR